MLIETIVVGMMEVNCYIISDSKKIAAIIDPGADYRKIYNVVKKNNYSPQCIILTHGHGDHIGAVCEFDLPVWIHKEDAGFITDPSKNLSALFNLFLKTKPASRFLEDNEVLNIGDLKIKVIHTPGHTPGSISLMTNNRVFTGDTLFCGGVGRTDLPYGSENSLFRSIKERLLVLPDDTVVYPGHGPSSTIGKEKETNPFLA